MPIDTVDPPGGRKKIKLTFDYFWDDPSQEKKNQPFLMDMVTLEKLYFQTIPESLEYHPESTWVAIAAPGRNNPLYQYTGGEDTLSFTLTWYSNDELRQDVLRKTKWLEKMGRNNGYAEKPHHVTLSFGLLFRGSKWIIEKCETTFGMFSRPHNMLPQQASTMLVLKRVTQDNRIHSQISKLDT